MALSSLPSLRVWLQSTSLLAVVAGYSALFVFGSSLAEAERLERHQRLVEQIRSGLSTGARCRVPRALVSKPSCVLVIPAQNYQRCAKCAGPIG